MWRFIKTLLRSAHSPIITNVDRELEQLKSFVAERGSEVGLQNLPPEDSIKTIAAAIRLIAEKRFDQLGLPDDFFARLDARLRSNQAEIEAQITAHQLRQIIAPVSQSPMTSPKPIRWIVAIGNVVVIFSLIGLTLEACGIVLGRSGYATLVLCAALALLNLTSGPTLARNSLAQVGYGLVRFSHYLTGRRLRIKAKRSDRRIEKLNQQREAEAVRRHFVEEWIAQASQEMLSHFEFYRTRAAEAARLLPNEKQRLDLLLESDPATFERDGVPAHATQPESWKQRSAAFSGLSA